MTENDRHSDRTLSAREGGVEEPAKSYELRSDHSRKTIVIPTGP
jgi:hypothetical protein